MTATQPQESSQQPRLAVLHLAAGNRWTGAAAPAFAEVEALRQAGIEAHYAYVGGYKLEAKLSGVAFAHPVIEKAQNPAAFLRSVAALTSLAREIGAGIIHAHLTYDHWLARFVAGRTSASLARTFHSRRVLRSDPFTASLVAATRSIFVINESFLSARAIRGRHPLFTPPPVRLSEFSPEGANVRGEYGIEPGVPLMMMIGKVSKGRGFETGLHTFATVRQNIPDARLMIVGHGEHRPALEQLAAGLGITSALLWAGYHEDDLAAHYRAADLLLFTARGSDEGHRAVLEAMACGVPPVVAPLDGMSALAGEFGDELIADQDTPQSLARRAQSVLMGRHGGELSRAVARHASLFAYGPAALRLLEGYQATR